MYFQMSEDVQEIVDSVMNKDCPYISTIGIDFRYLGTDRQSNVIQISKANPLLKYIAKKEDDDLLFITIHEEAFDRLSPEYQRLVIAHALDSVEFNSENGKTTIKGNKGTEISENVYLKYREPSVLAVFAGAAAVKQVEEEKKSQKKQKK